MSHLWGNTTQNTTKRPDIQVRGGKHFSTHPAKYGITHQSLVNASVSFGKVLHNAFISLYKSAQIRSWSNAFTRLFQCLYPKNPFGFQRRVAAVSLLTAALAATLFKTRHQPLQPHLYADWLMKMTTPGGLPIGPRGVLISIFTFIYIS